MRLKFKRVKTPKSKRGLKTPCYNRWIKARAVQFSVGSGNPWLPVAANYPAWGITEVIVPETAQVKPGSANATVDGRRWLVTATFETPWVVARYEDGTVMITLYENPSA
jgi:hypothetical protein